MTIQQAKSYFTCLMCLHFPPEPATNAWLYMGVQIQEFQENTHIWLTGQKTWAMLTFDCTSEYLRAAMCQHDWDGSHLYQPEFYWVQTKNITVLILYGYADEMSESRQTHVTLHDIDPQALEQLVQYAYTAEIVVGEGNVQVGWMISHLQTTCSS